MRKWKKSIHSQSQRLLRPSRTFPRQMLMLTWRCKISKLLQDWNPKSQRPDTTLIWSTRTNPNRAHLPLLWREKTRCWMLRKASPKHQETAGRVTIPTRPLTTKTSGALPRPHKSQAPNHHILESGSFLKTEDLKTREDGHAIA